MNNTSKIPLINNEQRINHCTIVSQEENGTVVSIYQDLEWDFYPDIARHGIGKTKVIFKNIPPKMMGQYKWIVYCMKNFATVGRGESMSVSTLIKYTWSLHHLCLFLNKRSITFRRFFNNELVFNSYLKQINNHGLASSFSGLIKALKSIDKDILGLSISNDLPVKNIRKVLTKLKNPSKQHAVIPERIYLNIIARSQEFVEDVYQNRYKLKAFISNIENFQSQSGRKDIENIGFDLTCESKRCHIKNLLTKYQVNSLSEFSTFIRMIQYICKVVVIAYTGMRSSECDNIMHGSLVKVKTDAKPYWKIASKTTKFTSHAKDVSWITSKNSIKAHKVLSFITKMLAKNKGVDYRSIPLLTSMSYFTWCTSTNNKSNQPININNVHISPRNAKLKEFTNERLFSGSLLLITQSDFNFLQEVDQFRSWGSEDNFKIGSEWNLTFHQLRRSLAYYASEKGLVTLPALKKQLKHISLDMTIYYTNSTKINPEYDHNKHICKDLESMLIESKIISYEKNIANNKHLYSPSGRKKYEVTLTSRDELALKAYNGEISYKTTDIGACMSLSPCDKKPLGNITGKISGCINCKDVIIDKSKIIKQIRLMRTYLRQYAHEDFEYRVISAELSEFEKCADNIKNYGTKRK